MISGTDCHTSWTDGLPFFLLLIIIIITINTQGVKRVQTHTHTYRNRITISIHDRLSSPGSQGGWSQYCLTKNKESCLSLQEETHLLDYNASMWINLEFYHAQLSAVWKSSFYSILTFIWMKPTDGAEQAALVIIMAFIRLKIRHFQHICARHVLTTCDGYKFRIRVWKCCTWGLVIT